MFTYGYIRYMVAIVYLREAANRLVVTLVWSSHDSYQIQISLLDSSTYKV